MTIYFGLELDNLVVPERRESGVFYFGPKRLLGYLELHLGLSGHPQNNDFLRIEQLRQALVKHSTFHPDAFYVRSFEADPLATATALLNRRDELVLSNWNFIPDENTPIRLKTIAQIENIAQTNDDGMSLSMGYADRFVLLEKTLSELDLPKFDFIIREPLEILPYHFQRLFDRLSKLGHTVSFIKNECMEQTSDLGAFQQMLLGKKGSIEGKKDGSILILKSKRSAALATFLAQLVKKNPSYRPVALIPEKNRTLDNAFIQEGLPSLGILSESLARPSLQILKLVTAFLWKPIDPFKVMEFVSLSVKPLRDDLAHIIASEMAQRPGVHSDKWRLTIKNYFEELEARANDEKDINLVQTREQYNFWFNRTRYNIAQTVPIGDVIEIFNYIVEWAKAIYDNEKSKPVSMLVLSEQAKRAVELLESLPASDKRLTNLQLERIVRTIYESSPISFKERQVHHLPYVHHNSAILEPIEKLVWWNFLDNEPPYFFSKWYKKEYFFFENIGIQLETPQRENERLLWQRIQPIINTKQQLILCLPNMVDGKEVHPHPLYGNLDAFFKNLEDLIVDIDRSKNLELLSTIKFNVPSQIELKQKYLGQPKPFIYIDQTDQLSKREQESYSSLDTLLYYPYKWVFQYQIGFHKSSILSIVKDYTLMGNLAHRVFEKLFGDKGNEALAWERPKIMDWVDKQTNELLEREAAVLLMYGREPDRVAFVNKLKFAVCNLMDMIRNNGWKIKGTEQKLEGKFLEVEIKGVADLVLENEKGELAVIDLKWKGSARRYNAIKSNEDLQLVLYSKLLTTNEKWAHTAFYIIEEGKMIARNNLAFKEAIAVTPDANHEALYKDIWNKMVATYQWRMQQIKGGKIEIRTEQTLEDIEDTMTANELMTLLEMKSKNAPFDDYKTLINLLQ
jgi:ATP-dependent helicase/nuclease subunit B